MMTRAQFVEKVTANAARVRAYRLGGDGSDGGCDCIGLIIGALRLAGETWAGVHGSNDTARNRLREWGKISSAGDLKVGDLVFKAREKGQAGYNLPASYGEHADQRDYYHVGVVMGLDPLDILHCTTVQGGIKRDDVLGAWRFRGVLTQVTEEETNEIWTNCVVTGGKLALRSAPDKHASILCWMPDGAKAAAAEEGNGWSRVKYGDKTGYSMTEYLAPEQTHVTLSLTREMAQRLCNALKNALE